MTLNFFKWYNEEIFSMIHQLFLLDQRFFLNLLINYITDTKNAYDVCNLNKNYNKPHTARTHASTTQPGKQTTLSEIIRKPVPGRPSSRLPQPEFHVPPVSHPLLLLSNVPPEIQFTNHTITHLKCTTLWFFSIFADMCNHHHNFRTFLLPQKETLHPLAITSLPPHPPHLQPSASVDFPVLDFSYK